MDVDCCPLRREMSRSLRQFNVFSGMIKGENFVLRYLPVKGIGLVDKFWFGDRGVCAAMIMAIRRVAAANKEPSDKIQTAL